MEPLAAAKYVGTAIGAAFAALGGGRMFRHFRDRARAGPTTLRLRKYEDAENEQVKATIETVLKGAGRWDAAAEMASKHDREIPLIQRDLDRLDKHDHDRRDEIEATKNVVANLRLDVQHVKDAVDNVGVTVQEIKGILNRRHE